MGEDETPTYHSKIDCDEIDLTDIGTGLLARAISQKRPGYDELEALFFPEKGETK